VSDYSFRLRATHCSVVWQLKPRRQHEAAAQQFAQHVTSCSLAHTMFWALGLVASFFVFAALTGFLERARRRAPPRVQIQNPPRDVGPRAATPVTQEATSKIIKAVEEPQSAFDKLRGAMDRDDTDIFATLQNALDELIRVGRSIGVCASCLNDCIPHLDVLSGSLRCQTGVFCARRQAPWLQYSC